MPEIVTGLMEVERQPVKKLQSQVDQKTVVISTLGTFKSKAAVLESAAKAIQTPGGFSARSASSSDSAKVSASASAAATVGTYTVKVAQTAQADSVAVAGLASPEQVLDLADFQIQVGDTTYRPRYVQVGEMANFLAGDVITFTLNGGTEQRFSLAEDSSAAEAAAAINLAVANLELTGVVARVNAQGWLQLSSSNPIQGIEDVDFTTDLEAAAPAITYTEEGLPRVATIADLEGYLNRLPAKLDAKLVQIAEDQYTLSVTSELTGAANTVALSALKTAAGPVDSVVFSGTFKAGNAITLAVNGTQLTYTVTASDLAGGISGPQVYTRIATAMASLIGGSDDPALEGVQAFASGSGLVVIGASPLESDPQISVTNGTALSRGAATVTRVVDEDIAGETLTVTEIQSGRDAVFSVNGIGVIRSSNVVSDVIAGVTFNLNSPLVPTEADAEAPISSIEAETFGAAGVYTAVINVSKGSEDTSASAIETFVAAYNDLISFYRTESIASRKPDERGVLNSNSTLRSFMDQLRSLYNSGIRLADGSSVSFSSIGVQVQRDGSLLVNPADLKTAVADGLQEKLAQGVVLGYVSGSQNFTSFLTRSLRSTGLLSTHINDVTTDQTRLQSRITEMEDKLSRIEQRYYRQYAALDALLFRLQTTSNALTSAIDSLVNSQKNN